MVCIFVLLCPQSGVILNTDQSAYAVFATWIIDYHQLNKCLSAYLHGNVLMSVDIALFAGTFQFSLKYICRIILV